MRETAVKIMFGDLQISLFDQFCQFWFNFLFAIDCSMINRNMHRILCTAQPLVQPPIYTNIFIPTYKYKDNLPIHKYIKVLKNIVHISKMRDVLGFTSLTAARYLEGGAEGVCTRGIFRGSGVNIADGNKSHKGRKMSDIIMAYLWNPYSDFSLWTKQG